VHSRDDLDGPAHRGSFPAPLPRLERQNLSDRVVSLYIAVLREAGSVEDLHYLNWAKLVEVWRVTRDCGGTDVLESVSEE